MSMKRSVAHLLNERVSGICNTPAYRCVGNSDDTDVSPQSALCDNSDTYPAQYSGTASLDRPRQEKSSLLEALGCEDDLGEHPATL